MGVPASVMMGILSIENAKGDPHAQSPMNYDRQGRPIGTAKGLGQIMDFHWTPEELAAGAPYNPEASLAKMAKILQRGFERFGNWDSAAAAYFGAADADGNPTLDTDVTGTSGVEYVKRFRDAASRYAGIE